MLVAVLPYILVALVLVLVGVCGFLVRRLRTTLRRPAVPGVPQAPPVAAAAGPSLLRLRQSFVRAGKLLKTYAVGRNSRYRIPWFMLIGETAAGKTTLLSSSGLNVPFGASQAEMTGRKEGCTWWFFDHGVVLDTAGDYVLRTEARPADGRGWQSFLRLLQRHRPACPIDGVIVTIPCTDLVGPPEQSATRITRAAQKATLLAEKLWEAQRTLGLCLPVYLVVTKCDQISGFQSFCAALPPPLRQEIFGWSNPYTLEAAYAPHWVDEALTTVDEQLARIQLEVMAAHAPLQDSDGFFLFPAAAQAMREPLRAYVDQLFAASVYHETFFFRGLYFCGDSQPDTQSEPLLATPPAAPTAMPMEPTRAAAGRRHLCFVKHLLEQKIFPESRLARPTSKTLVSRNRAVLAAQTLLGLTVLVGSLGLWSAYSRLTNAKETMQPVLREIARDVDRLQGESATNDALFYKETLSLLKGMAHANASSLYSLFMPASWFDTMHVDLVSAIRTAYNKIILQSLVHAFKHKAQVIINTSGRQGERFPAGLQGLVIEPPPEFMALRRFIEELVELEKYLTLYNTNIAAVSANDLQALGQVVKYLFGVELPADFYAHASYYQHALSQASSQTIQPGMYRAAVTARVRNLIKPLCDRLFVTHPLLGSVHTLAQSVEQLKRQRPEEMTVSALREVLEAINQAQAVLARPEYAWLGRASLELGEPMERLLVAMAGSEFLGPEVSEEVRNTSEAAFQQFKDTLKTLQTSLTGPLLLQEGGQVRFELAPGVLTLQASLGHLLGLEFIKREAQRAMRTALIPHTHLIWDARLLEEALKLYDPYSRFRSEDLPRFPLELTRQVEAVAVRQLRANLSDLIAQAQIFAPTPDGFGRARIEAGIGPEIRHLQGATPALGRLIHIFNDSGLGEASWALLTLVTTQAFGMLEAVDQLLHSESPYAIKDGSFAWWNGTMAPAQTAFEVRDARELSVYLTLQRDRVKYLARTYAEPLVALLTNRPRQRTSRQELLLAKWQGILAELEDYDNKKPGNAITALETFVLQDMPPLTAQNCLPTLAGHNTLDLAGDFFSQHRHTLHQELTRRCQSLAQELVLQEYGRIAQTFNQRLAGKFPFTSGAPGGEETEADPQAMRDFYRVFDTAVKTVRDLLHHSPRGLGSRDQALAFLEQMEAARAFFAPFLDGDARQHVPTFDVAVEFRVNKPRERGGHQIIDWHFSIGEQQLRARDPERQGGRWRLGEPLRVALRWAKDAPDEPFVNGGESTVEVKDGTAVYAYTNRWSLLRLLRAHVSAAADFERFVDPKPHTLKFVVDTRPKQDKRGVASPGESSTAQVFIRVTVMAPDKKEGQVLPLLPVRAPELSLTSPVASSH
jgi:type VI secretion system protein ImpL